VDSYDRDVVDEVAAQLLRRIRMSGHLPGKVRPSEISWAVRNAITPGGMGVDQAVGVWVDTLEADTVHGRHPLHLAGGAPLAPAGPVAELLLALTSPEAGTWHQAAGMVWAENQALDWVRGLLAMPTGSGGTFTEDPLLAHVAALTVARGLARRRGDAASSILVGPNIDPSLAAAAKLLDLALIPVAGDHDGRIGASDLEVVAKRLGRSGRRNVAAIVGCVGSGTTGLSDRHDGLAEIAHEHGWWYHLDGTYGAAALVDRGMRDSAGAIETADSAVVRLDVWVGGPKGSTAVVYRDPAQAREFHTKDLSHRAEATSSEMGSPLGFEWDPAEYAPHMSRRGVGAAVWFLLAAHGTDAIALRVQAVCTIADTIARFVDDTAGVELIGGSSLGVLRVAVSRMDAAELRDWADAQRQAGKAELAVRIDRGRPVLWLRVTNPSTDPAAVCELLGDLAARNR
jgi:glutamate/tyrosine decarboxylase-like PLP-dependent enzyme